MELANYLFFTNQCEAALGFYQRCGLGSIANMQRYGDENPAMNGLVQHARFEGRGFAFCASDNDDAEPMRGSAHYLTFDDADAARVMFERLAEGGIVTTPIGPQAWSKLYGKVTDRFGVQWMMHYTG